MAVCNLIVVDRSAIMALDRGAIHDSNPATNEHVERAGDVDYRAGHGEFASDLCAPHDDISSATYDT